jgi:phosphate transport system permease protein
VLPAKGAAPAVLSSFEVTPLSPPFVSNPALMEASSALPYQLYALITAGLGGDLPEGVEWGVALTLLLVVLSFYAIGIGTRYYFRKKLHQ